MTGEVYYIINVLNAIDAVDYEKAILKKLRSGLVIDFKNTHSYLIWLRTKQYLKFT